MKRLLSIVVLVAIVAGFAFAGGQGESEAPMIERTEATPSKYHPPLGMVPVPDEEIRIGVLVKTLINDFWLDLKNGYEDAAAEYGVSVQVFAAPSEGDLLVQKQILDDMVAQEFDVIIVSPITDSNLLPGLTAATEAGIPIINVIDAYINPELQARHDIEIATFISTDFAENTRLAVDYVAELLGDDGGEIMHIMGLPGNPSAEDRRRGYEEQVAEYPQLESIGVWPGDWDRAKSMNVAADVLQSNPNLKAIVGANDTIALGALQAVRNAGKEDQVIVAGVDAIPDAIRSIMDGGLVSTVAFFQYQAAYTAVEVALQINAGTFDADAHEEIYVFQEVWHADNIEEKVDEYRNQYVGLQDF
jgi:D-allose transport system substrate-binding protein